MTELVPPSFLDDSTARIIGRRHRDAHMLACSHEVESLIEGFDLDDRLYFAELFVSDDEDTTRLALLPEGEQELVAEAVNRRRANFADARWCAHQALRPLGADLAEQPIGKGMRGMPLWPTGVVGSMTHTDRYRAAIVAPRSSARSIGIDAEPNDPLPEGVLESIATPSELKRVADLQAKTPRGGIRWDRLLFCAKEATYKAWYPVTGRWLGFSDAEIILAEDGSFAVRILIDPTAVDNGAPVMTMRGRYVHRRGLLLTLIELT